LKIARALHFEQPQC